MDQEKTTFTCPFGTYAYRRMPYGLCNTPATFQRCMLAIFHDMIEEFVEVFMKDFSVFGNSFDNCPKNLDKMLQRCKDANLVLKCKKCHFMVKEGILLRHKVSGAVLEVDKAKIDIISKLSPLLMSKALEQDAKPHLIRWIMLLQEFDIEIKDKKGIENVAADHLSQIDNEETSDDSDVDDNFPSETLMETTTKDTSWFAYFANYLADPYLFKVCSDGMIRRCVSRPETRTILDQCHHRPTTGHYGPNTTAKKALDSGFYWPTIIKEAHTLVRLCEACQKTGNISKHDEIPLNSIQVCEVFNIWGIDFMGPFPKSYKFEYILVAIDYVSKWSEAQALPTNNARVVISILKKLFCHFVKDNLAVWSRKLDDALWAFKTAYKTPIETTPYKLLYGKNCHSPFVVEHRAYWALKNCNPDLIAADEKRMSQLHELDELRHQMYENSCLYKARTKVWHDRKLKMRKEFKHGNKVLLFHSKYVELYGKDGKTFIVNDHRLKLCHEEENDQREEVTLFYHQN
ncbi:reverse transcriptase domain-containing protein [Tanacetum coccineum]